MTRTPQYEFAKSVTQAKVVIEIYDDAPYTENQIVRARCEVDGLEYGAEYPMRPSDPLSIGTVVEQSLKRLLTSLSE